MDKQPASNLKITELENMLHQLRKSNTDQGKLIVELSCKLKQYELLANHLEDNGPVKIHSQIEHNQEIHNLTLKYYKDV
jgi:ribosomal protein S8